MLNYEQNTKNTVKQETVKKTHNKLIKPTLKHTLKIENHKNITYGFGQKNLKPFLSPSSQPLYSIGTTPSALAVSHRCKVITGS